jgi:hypothetical protein
MDTIKFSQNWNSKFANPYFTTIRMYDQKKHYPGKLLECSCPVSKDKIHVISAEIVAVNISTLEAIPEWVFMLDTGYHKQEALRIFRNMYEKKHPDYLKKQFALLTIRTRKEKNVILTKI